MRWTRMTTCAAATIASPGAIPPAPAQDAPLDRLQIHGYPSQGYG